MSLAKILAPLTGRPATKSCWRRLSRPPSPSMRMWRRSSSIPIRASPCPLSACRFRRRWFRTSSTLRKKSRRSAEQRAQIAARGGREGRCGRCVEHPKKSDAVTCSFRRAQGLYFRAVAQAAELSDLVAFRRDRGAGFRRAERRLRRSADALGPSDPPVGGSAVATRAQDRARLGWRRVGRARRFGGTAVSEEGREHRRSQRSNVAGSAERADFADLREFLALHGLSATGTDGRAERAIRSARRFCDGAALPAPTCW